MSKSKNMESRIDMAIDVGFKIAGVIIFAAILGGGYYMWKLMNYDSTPQAVLQEIAEYESNPQSRQSSHASGRAPDGLVARPADVAVEGVKRAMESSVDKNMKTYKAMNFFKAGNMNGCTVYNVIEDQNGGEVWVWTSSRENLVRFIEFCKTNGDIHSYKPEYEVKESEEGGKIFYRTKFEVTW